MAIIEFLSIIAQSIILTYMGYNASTGNGGLSYYSQCYME